MILIDPGIDGSDLNQLADDLDRLDIPVVAGFSTHPHWDHLLWHSRFGDVPRYATPDGAHAASEARERAQAMAAESASGIPLVRPWGGRGLLMARTSARSHASRVSVITEQSLQ